ncbi:epigen isoform X2 [Tachysurus vachellii]|uniref:epigen isoform X2 n=1 Tax=Tachysurus vachellii TaxID=175792 RepID=UPI00296AD01E|nr:epigen isoform X2 [Tachysurus vachellii]
MSQCVEKSLCFVSLFYSRTVKCAETKLTLKLNKTQNLNFTHNFTYNEPLVVPVYRPCSGEHESLCIHGLCSYPENINNAYCTCHPGFIGKRCEHQDLTSGVKMSYNLEEVIAIICGVTFLLACTCVIGCCCYRKSYCSCTSLGGSKPASPYTNHENSV